MLQTPLPRELSPWQVDLASRDPFVPYAPPAPMEPAPAKVVRKLEPIAEPAPTAPPMTYRFLGRMLTPEGRPITLLARGDAAIEVKAGQQLEEGYRVDSVNAQAVRLVYPPLGTVVDIAIPAAPSR